MNYEEHIKNFKIANTELMSYLLSKQGGFAPMVTVLVKKNEEVTVMAIPVPEAFLNSELSKDMLANALPSLFEHVVQQGMEPICFSFSSEAWLRKTPEGVKELPEDWKDLPKIECLISTYESKDNSSMDIHEIVREGKIANENGELIDAIVLKPYDTGNEQPKSIEGRFTGIFDNYLKSKKDEQTNC